MLKSTNDFIDLLQSNNCDGIIASLDVESLFTNVPIDATIEIILQHAYHHSTVPPPKIPKEILKQMLELCTKEAPFRSPSGGLFLQVEGVAMGSPLGPTFANFYMGHLEEQVFSVESLKPSLYARYVDDIFVQIDNVEQLIKLKNCFQHNSVLTFTYELSVNKKLPFLDVMVQASSNKFHTTVYHKPTDHGTCLNAHSECIDRYKDSVIMNYLNRAYKVTVNWKDFHNEVQHIKQMLVNNNYSNSTIDMLTNKFIKKKQTVQNASKPNESVIPLYYHSQMHSNYKVEERTIKEIIDSNTNCSDPNQRLKVIIYYKNLKTSNLVMKNNLTPKPSPLQQTNVCYKFSCPFPHSKAEQYIGLTQTTLSRRLTMHAQTGSIYQHFLNEHQTKPTRVQLTENTTIIARADNRYKLAIKEALLILHNNPSINKQFDNFTNILKIHAHRNPNQYHFTKTPFIPPLTITPPSLSFSQNHNTVPFIISPTDTLLSPSSQQNLCMFPSTHTPIYPPSPPPLLKNLNIVSTTPSPIEDLLSPPHSLNRSMVPNIPTPINTPPFPILSHSPIIATSQHTDCIKVPLETIPDMNKILLGFGIITSRLNQVPLKSYEWWRFSKNRGSLPPPHSPTHEESDARMNSPTISQRIHTMVRRARRVNGNSSGHRTYKQVNVTTSCNPSSIYRF